MPPEPPVPPTDRILYTVVAGGHKPESTWITNNCSDNVFDPKTGKGYLVLKDSVSELTGWDDDIESKTCTIFLDEIWYTPMKDNNITSVAIPNQITTIGESAFYYYENLFSINFPNNISTIGDNAFCGCSSLTSIILPSSLTLIGVAAFLETTRLATITCYSINPPQLGEDNFTDCHEDTLNVPAESVQAYLDDTNWNNAFNGNIQPIQE